MVPTVVLSPKLEITVKVFLLVYNVGQYRRKAVGTDRMHDFFRADNEEAQEIRKLVFYHTLHIF